MKKTQTLLVLLLLSTITFSQASKKEVKHILLKNLTIIDAISEKGKVGNILIENDKIKIIDYSNHIEIPKGTISFDLTDKYIIPGLIDGHVHITHGTEQDAKDHLRIALQNGITGVRDMGGDGRMLGLLKKNMQIGENVGPDIFFGSIIAGPKFFEKDPRPQSVALGAIAGKASWQRSITHETDFKQIVAEAKGIGSTAIKIYANVEPELIKKVSDEAKKQGLKVWSHAAMAPSKPTDVILGGSECISHAGDIFQYELVKELKDRHDFSSKDEALKYRKKLLATKWDRKTPEVKHLLEKMKDKNVIVDATLFVYTVGLSGNASGKKADSSRYKLAMKSTKIIYDAGIKINAGSDHMIDVKPYQSRINLHRELELLSEAGLSNFDIIKSATIINAEVVGEEKNIGTIEEGKLANLVILNSNPLENISNTKDIKLVIKRGKIIN